MLLVKYLSIHDRVMRGIDSAAASSLPIHDEQFIDGNGLSRSLLERNIVRYLGPNARCRRALWQVRCIAF